MSNKIELEIDDKRLNNLRHYAAEIDAENADMMGCSCCKLDLAHLFFHGVQGYIDLPLEDVLDPIYSYNEMLIYDYEVKDSTLILTLHEEFDQEDLDLFMKRIDEEQVTQGA